jgi:N-acetyl-alpha-D-glucosaminyl L-malate synthase BshA
VKNASRVIQVFHAAAAKVRARLVLIGEGPEVQACRRLASELGISDRVAFLGEQQYIEAILPYADLFLLPSDHESFGLAALEAMACEVPPVASRIGGLPELIDDGVSGFLHDLDDLEGMARSAIRLLNDEPMHREMAEAARRQARDRFCDSKIVPVYEAYYAEILHGHQP